MVTIEDVTTGAHSAGLAGLPIVVHSSLRSFGFVEGGADTVIDGLLESGCTVVVPTFTYDFRLQPPSGQRLARNGWRYDDTLLGSRSDVFSPVRNYVSPEMGAIPSALLRRTNRTRSSHPANSMAAVGPLANEIIDTQTYLEVYGPFQKIAELGGKFVLMGVGLTSLTAIHLAEKLSGRELFRRWAKGPTGELLEIAVGSCSGGFDSLSDSIEPIESSVIVGNSCWRVLPAKLAICRFAEAILREPEITDCKRPQCERCPDAIAGGPILAEARG